VNMTNGVTPRRWVRCANKPLSDIFTKHLGSEKWLTDMNLLKAMIKKKDDPKLQMEWMAAKHQAKEKPKLKADTHFVLMQNSAEQEARAATGREHGVPVDDVRYDDVPNSCTLSPRAIPTTKGRQQSDEQKRTHRSNSKKRWILRSGPEIISMECFMASRGREDHPNHTSDDDESAT